MTFSEDDTIEITIEGIGPESYLADGIETIVTADVIDAPNGDDVAAFVELQDDIGGLDEGRIDRDREPMMASGVMDMLTTYDSEKDEGPHYAGRIKNVRIVE